jgi:hypothetical protein
LVSTDVLIDEAYVAFLASRLAASGCGKLFLERVMLYLLVVLAINNPSFFFLVFYKLYF